MIRHAENNCGGVFNLDIEFRCDADHGIKHLFMLLEVIVSGFPGTGDDPDDTVFFPRFRQNRLSLIAEGGEKILCLFLPENPLTGLSVF